MRALVLAVLASTLLLSVVPASSADASPLCPGEYAWHDKPADVRWWWGHGSYFVGESSRFGGWYGQWRPLEC